MHQAVAKAIEECSEKCAKCTIPKTSTGRIQCSTLQCEPQQRVIRIANEHGELI